MTPREAFAPSACYCGARIFWCVIGGEPGRRVAHDVEVEAFDGRRTVLDEHWRSCPFAPHEDEWGRVRGLVVVRRDG